MRPAVPSKRAPKRERLGPSLGTALLFLCLFPALSPLFSQKYKQNYRAFKMQNFSESKKEQTKGTKQIYLQLRIKTVKLTCRLGLDKFWAKACKIAEKTPKKIQEYQKHRKRQQKLNINDLESTFNASDKKMLDTFSANLKTKYTIISIKTEQHDEISHLHSKSNSPNAEKDWQISPPPQHFKQFIRNFSINIYFVFVSFVTIKACAWRH